MNLHAEKKNLNLTKLVLIVLGVISLAGIGGMIFWLGRKSTASSQSNLPTPAQERTRLEQEIAQKIARLAQLSQTSDQVEISKLRQEITNLEQQLQRLPAPAPGPSPLPVPPPPRVGQKQLTISYKALVGDQHEYLNLNNPSERVLIAKNNPLFASGTNLTTRGNHYVLTFEEKDVTLDPVGRYTIDNRNTNFTLVPAYQPPLPPPGPEPEPTPPRPQPNEEPSDGFGPEPGPNFPSEEPNPNSLPQRIDKVFFVDYIGKEYINFVSANRIHDPSAIGIFINRKNPQLAGKKIGDGKAESDYAAIPKCRISFLEDSDIKTSGVFDDYVFGEDFDDFDLQPLGEWPNVEEGGREEPYINNWDTNPSHNASPSGGHGGFNTLTHWKTKWVYDGKIKGVSGNPHGLLLGQDYFRFKTKMGSVYNPLFVYVNSNLPSFQEGIYIWGYDTEYFVGIRKGAWSYDSRAFETEDEIKLLNVA